MDTVEVQRDDPEVVTTGDDDTRSAAEAGHPGLRKRATRVVRRLGFASAISGVVVLALVWSQPWDTGLHQAKTGGRPQVELPGLLAEQQVVSADGAAGELRSAEPTGTGSPDGPGEAESPADTAETTTTEAGGSSRRPGPVNLVPRDLLHFDEGSVVGRISIPAIDVEQLMVEGIDPQSLTLGPGHYPTTSLPGLAGNAAVAGHRTTWGAPFNRIDELVPGDRIEVQMAWGEFIYEVMAGDAAGSAGHRIVDPTDVWVLDDVGDNRLTLTSCHPEYSARQRIIVVARLIGEPASVEGST